MTKKFSLTLIAILLGVGFSTSVFAQAPGLPAKTSWADISSLWAKYDNAVAYVNNLVSVPGCYLNNTLDASKTKENCAQPYVWLADKKAALISRLDYAKQQIIIHELVLRLSPNDDPISPARSNGVMMGNIVSDTGCYDTLDLNGFYTNKNSDAKADCTDPSERWLTSYEDLVTGINGLFSNTGCYDTLVNGVYTNKNTDLEADCIGPSEKWVTPTQPLKAASLRAQLVALGEDIEGSYDFSCPAPKKSDDSLETHFTFNTDVNSLTGKFATAISIDTATFTVTFSPNITVSKYFADTDQQYCNYRCWNGVSSDTTSGYTYNLANLANSANPVTDSCEPRTRITDCGGSLISGSEHNSTRPLVSTKSQYEQTWTGTADAAGSWQPVKSLSYNETASECAFRCIGSPSIQDEINFHREPVTGTFSSCKPNRKETACTGTTPSGSTTVNTPSNKTTFTQVWDSTLASPVYTPSPKTWTYNTTLGECNYKCSSGYHRSGSSCVLDIIETACGGTSGGVGTVKNTPNSKTTFTQTWNGSTYLPASKNWSYSQSSITECGYKCDTGLTKCSSNNSCSANIKLEPCSIIRGSSWTGSETYTYNSTSCSYQYVSNNCSCATGYGLVGGNCVTNVFYDPQKTYVVYADDVSALKYCQEQNSGFTSSSYTTTNVSASIVFMKRYSRIMAGVWINNLTSSDFPAISTLTCN